MDAERIYRRYRELQDYVGWTDDDAERVRRAGALLESRLPELIDDFYAEIKRHPDARRVFADDAQVARLKVSLRTWLHELFTGPYDAEYAVRRWRVGLRHVEVGLEQIFANAALARLRRGLARALCAEWKADQAELHATIDSLNALIDLDLAKIEDAYAAEYIDRLQKSQRLAAIGQIAGGIAHELRNPLNVIKTSAYFLLNAKSCSLEKVHEHLHRIGKHVNHANDVITALASFARPPAQRFASVSIVECVRHALERYPAPSGVRVQSDLPDNLPIVQADAAQLVIVFGNLIRNACDAMPGGGTLAIEAAARNGLVEVRFADTGVGIAADDLAKITEALFSTKAKGMGLGLAISTAIIAKNSGKLLIQSEIGRGSAFTVQLPAAEED